MLRIMTVRAHPHPESVVFIVLVNFVKGFALKEVPMSDGSTTAAVTILAESLKLTARGFDDTSCAWSSLAPVREPEGGSEAWALLAGAANALGWLTDGVPGKRADWNDAPSLALVLVALGDPETLLLRFRVALMTRLRELAEEGGDNDRS